LTVPAILALADGSVFKGLSIGSEGETIGEVVFNTALTGYQEILTDPSYARQIVTLTYPHIGSVGVNPEDAESDAVWAQGLIIRDLPLLKSNFRSTESLSDYLVRHSIVAIADIDTRRLTRILRDKGAQSGCILAGEGVDSPASIDSAIEKAKSFSGLAGMDLAKTVCTSKSYAWKEGSWQLGQGHIDAKADTYHVVAYDFGVKRNILRMLADRGCKLTVVPAQTPASEVLALKPDGVFLSNGPGDPEPCDYAIAAIKDILAEKIPTFGICLGHQLLALASGAQTVKMKFGHHGANHPVQDLATKLVMITSQNHGFAVDYDTANSSKSVKISHKHLNDQTVAGLEVEGKKCFSVQYHPEAGPGPNDGNYLFDQFLSKLK
jgi:carbamoyl-phosphate synthase small subunit